MKAALLAAAVLLSACAGTRPEPPPPSRVLTGLDVLEADGFKELRGKRVGVIANRASVDARGRLIVDVLASARGVRLVEVLSPEHGFSASLEQGHISSSTIRAGGRDIPLVSLYTGGAAGMRPRPEMLRGLDALVFDIPDVGARFYTYVATMGMALEEAKKAGVEFIVLDRPNPINGVAVQGPIPDEPGLVGRSEVAYFPVPTRHGMTPGELALMHNADVGHPRLRVIPLKGWTRSMWFDDTGLPWVPPSPNMPDLAAATLYPGIANIEESNLSVGRGTPHPFGWVGAPWLDAAALARRLSVAGLPGVEFTEEDQTPSKSLYAGVLCRGVRMTVTDRDAVHPLQIFAHLAAGLRDLHPSDFKLNWSDSTQGETRKLVAATAFKTAYDRGASGADLALVMDPPTTAFQDRRRPFLLYADGPAAAAAPLRVPSPSELSVEELAGQVFMIAVDTEIAVSREADVRAGRLGGALLRWDRFTGPEARALAYKLDQWARSAPHPIPFWTSTDHEGGATFTQRRYGVAPFPGNMALGAAGSEDLARASAEVMGRELRALGISVTFAPSLDVNSNPANPIIGARSFGEDPALVSRLGVAALEGYRAGGILAVPKHFPGHGDTADDSHLGLPVSTKTLAELERTELAPFRAAFAAGAEGVMPAHMVFPALGTAADRPVTLSSAAIEGFLRGRMGFKGLVFSDSLDMGAIANAYGSSEAAVLSLLAGNDVLLAGKGDFPAAFSAVVSAVDSGRLPRARLEASVARILGAKRRLGLFDGAEARPLDGSRLARDRAIARAVADASVTLVKNKGLIPLKLKPGETIAAVLVHTPRYADEANYFNMELIKRHPRVQMEDLAAVDPSSAAVEAVASRVRGASVIILGTFQYGGVLPAGQVRLIRRLEKEKAPLIVVSLMNPYDLSASTGADAALAAYGMTLSSLDAAVRLLFGSIPPRGKLPVTIPGAYPRGSGLTNKP